MIQRKAKQPEPFANVVVEKRAYDISDIEPENYRKEIKGYVQSLYPFLSSGLQNVNYKKPPDEEGNAIGFIQYEANGIAITIPVIIDEYNLKEPTVGIYNGRAIPIDKEYISYLVDEPEYGTQVSDQELPGNMQYITQSGLFQNNDSGIYKSSERIISTLFDEDRNNPYHYYGTIIKKAYDNTISVDDSIYCAAAEMLKMVKEAEDNKELAKCEGMCTRKIAEEVPAVQKLSDTGKYRSVMIGGAVRPCRVFADLFRIEGGETKAYAETVAEEEMLECSNPTGGKTPELPTWGYGDVYGTGFEYADQGLYHDNVKPQDASMSYMMFSTMQKRKNHNGLGSNHADRAYSVPYYVDMVEDMAYGEGEKATVMHVKSMADGHRYKFIITDKVAEVKKIDQGKLKGSPLRYMYDEVEDVYLVPNTYGIVGIGNNRVDLDGYKDGYTQMIKDIESEYPNQMTILSKGANLYTVNVSDGGGTYKHANVSGNGALLLANYYTGNDHSNINEYKTDTSYAYKGDTEKKAIYRGNVKPIRQYRGEYKKLAALLSTMSEGIKKVADIEPVVDGLIGIEGAIDDEHVDTTNISKSIDNVIGRISELLLMSRLGKNELSESILTRALHALVGLSNELRGMANAPSL